MPILNVVVYANPERARNQMTLRIPRRSCREFTTIAAALAALLAMEPTARAETRVTGLDVSYYQGNISQANWNTIHNTDGRAFTFIRATRGGATGTYDPNNTANDTLARRYDDPYFVQNITNATNAGMFAGPYHFARPDVIASTPNANGIPNNGTDEANHFIEMAGNWMRPGYLLPVFDFEAGSAQRTPSQLAQFAIDFSNRIYAVKGIRPAVYIGNPYASPMDSIPESAALVAAYPTLWNPRWPTSPDIQNGNPGDYTPTIYGPWDNSVANPWSFWQYTSSGHLQGIGGGGPAVDLDVAHGGIEFVKDRLVPALWVSNSSGDWSSLANWNSGETPTPPPTGPGQLPPTSNALPTPRLPGPNDTVIFDRPAVTTTITLASGTQNIRKLYVREPLNITGGTLNIGYVPSPDSTPISAEFTEAVSLGGAANLSVHTLQVDFSRTFTLAGGTLTFNTIKLNPSSVLPAKLVVTANVILNPLAGASAAIVNGTGSGKSGFIDLGGVNRMFTIGDGAAAIDLAINVPITNGGLTKAGAGTLALGGLNSYTGDTIVQAGTLRLGNASLADSSAVYLSNGTLLDLNFSGTDYVRKLFFNGAAQPDGTWGSIGSGAQYTSPFLIGAGKLNVTTIPPVPGHVIDDFEANQGHFNWPYNNAPASQTFGLTSSTTISRALTEHQGAGAGSQLLNLVASGTAAWQLRHMSGIGAGLAGEPAGNEKLDATGYVGFWLKTDDAGITVRIGIDDPVAGNSALERGFAQNVTPDNQWHLYQWNFAQNNQWDAYSGGANGVIDAVDGTVAIDSIWFTGAGNAQIYLDNVSHNPLGVLAAAAIPGDFNGDGAVDFADYTMWRNSFGTTVIAGTKADGNGNGVIDSGDYVLWRKQLAATAGGSALLADTPIPEPPTTLLVILTPLTFLAIRRRPLAV